jgi:formamidopyrimidine-DNA glycosylase
VGREVVEVGRRAKYLMIGLDGPDVLIVHLGMSGRLTISGGSAPPEPHEHLSFGLSGGRRLRFRDPRRFGLVLVRSRSRLDRDRHFAHLGREPLAPAIDGAFLARSAVGRRAPVKSFLMDGRIVVGVGNIYACEALHRAGVHPQRKVNRISAARWGRLARSVVEVLEDAIEQGGTTLNDFADGEGNPGYFQIALSVYDQEGRPCGRCGSTIRRIVQSGRSTFYCPGCQR